MVADWGGRCVEKGLLEENKIWRGRKRGVKGDGGKVRRYINMGGERWR